MKQEHEKFKKFGMVIDLDKCTGCGSCMVACMAENNVPFKKDETDKLKSITWMRVYKLTNDKPFPDNDICYLQGLACTAKVTTDIRPAFRSAPQRPPIMIWKQALSVKFTHAVSGAGIVWPPARIMPGISTGGTRSGPMEWKKCLAPRYRPG